MTTTIAGDVGAWFTGSLPGDLFTAPPEISIDTDEIVVVGTIAEPDLGADATESERATAARARIKRFREDTREHRMAVAEAAQRKFQRTVSWGVVCGDQRVMFTNLSVPVMTRLRQPERKVLDTLVAAGVARSRSDALGWCVRLVGSHESDWLRDLEDALVHVERVRSEGPRSF